MQTKIAFDDETNPPLACRRRGAVVVAAAAALSSTGNDSRTPEGFRRLVAPGQPQHKPRVTAVLNSSPDLPRSRCLKSVRWVMPSTDPPLLPCIIMVETRQPAAADGFVT